MKPKSGPLCVVTIGFQTFLMPLTAGMKAVQLLAQAVECEDIYEGGPERRYNARAALPVQFTTVRDEQVTYPESAPKRPRRRPYVEDLT